MTTTLTPGEQAAQDYISGKTLTADQQQYMPTFDAMTNYYKQGQFTPGSSSAIRPDEAAAVLHQYEAQMKHDSEAPAWKSYVGPLAALAAVVTMNPELIGLTGAGEGAAAAYGSDLVGLGGAAGNGYLTAAEAASGVGGAAGATSAALSSAAPEAGSMATIPEGALPSSVSGATAGTTEIPGLQTLQDVAVPTFTTSGGSAIDAIQASLAKSLTPEVLATNAGKQILMQEVSSLIQTGKLSAIDGQKLVTGMLTSAAATAGGAGITAATNGAIAPNVSTPIARAGLNALQGKSGIPSLASALVNEGANVSGLTQYAPGLTKLVSPIASSYLSNAYRGLPTPTAQQIGTKLAWGAANSGLGWAQNKVFGS